ncbi:MAG: hypothetical protein U9O98_04335 [Asgard group archaeon]|nr:hypothetical protein [Asgard group archaeon]
MELKISSTKMADYFPRHFKHYLPKLNEKEISILIQALVEIQQKSKSDYRNFCEAVINAAMREIGYHPNLEFMAAEIAFEIRKFTEIEKLANLSNNAFVLLPYIKALIAKNSLSRAIANIRIVESKIGSEDFAQRIDLFLIKAELEYTKGNLTDALFITLTAKEYCNNASTHFYFAESDKKTVEILEKESKILLAMGRYEKAYEDIIEGLTIAKQLDYKPLIVKFELYHGDYLIQYRRNFTEGSDHHQRAAKLAKELLNPHLIALTLKTIGENLKTQRNLIEGLRFCKHAEQLFKKIGDEQKRLFLVNTIADLLLNFGKTSEAISILLELEITNGRKARTYLNLVYAFIQTDDLDQAETYLEKAEKKLRGQGNLPGEFLLIYYKGLIEFQSGEFAQAEETFAHAQEFAEMNKLSYQALKANLQLINVLVTKNKAFPSKRNYKKARYAIDELNSNIKHDDSSIDYNSLLLLKATLLFSNKEFSKAKELFKKLKENFEKLELRSQVDIVENYLERIPDKIKSEGQPITKVDNTDMISSIDILQQSANISQDIFTFRDDSSGLSQEPLDIQAKPQMLLLLSDSGLPLYSHYFSERFKKMDETLISGFLGAIMSFTEKLETSNDAQQNLFKRGFLQGIKHGNFEILIERSPNFIVAVIAEKENYLLRRQVRRFSDELSVLHLIDEEPLVVMEGTNRYYIEGLISKIF